MTTDATSVLSGFRVRETTYRGTPLRYAVGGSGPPLVLVHGLGGAASNWLAIAPALAAERRVIVPELPGPRRHRAAAGGADGRPVRGRRPRRAGGGGRAAGSLGRALARRPRRTARRHAAAGGGHRSRARGGAGDLLRQPLGRGRALDRRARTAGPARRPPPGGVGGLRARPHGRVRLVGSRRPAGPRSRDRGSVPLRPRRAHGHGLRRAGADRNRSAAGARPRPLSLPVPLGRAGQLGAALGRHGVRPSPRARRSA